MKRTTILLTALLFSGLFVSAQKIKFEKSLSAASTISAEQHKPLLILISAPPAVENKKYLLGLTDPEVVNTINQNFISYMVTLKDTASRKIVSDYKIRSFPAFIFLDSQGALLLKGFGSFPTAKTYLNMLSNAVLVSKQTSLFELDKQYNSGYRNAEFLKEYIIRRKKVGITENAKLIDDYVNFLSIGDLSKYDEVLFILEAGPATDSRAFRSILVNKHVVDSVFKTIPSVKRSAIYSTIINNTMREAIATKSFQKAQSAATFSRSTWGKDYNQAQKMYTLRLLQYYQGIKDTANYLSQATYYYDQYYMRISADSIKRLDAKYLERLKKYSASVKARADSLGNGETGTIMISSGAGSVATELNNAAWNFYSMGTKNQNHLSKALLWSKRSVELKPTSAYYDTLAHILYRLGLLVEAESTQRTAIALAKSEKRDYKQMEEELTKIKKKTL